MPSREQLVALGQLASARRARDDMQAWLDRRLAVCEELGCSPTLVAQASGLSRQTIHNRRRRLAAQQKEASS